jgi:formylglycine-generating enzyme required for sulfatase activity
MDQGKIIQLRGISRHKRSILVASSSILVLIVFIIALSVVKSWSISQPPPSAILEQATAGVRHNSDWQPFIRRFDSLDMLLVPAGCFSMGSTDLQLMEAIKSCDRFYGNGKCEVDFAMSETPHHKVCFEQPFYISRTEVTNRQYGSSSSTDMNAMYRAPLWPRETVTWQAAAQFCADHHARLPSEAEWEYSARGPDNLIYPWGNEFHPDNVVSGRLTPANVASKPGGASWVGAFDMSGNAAEWVADEYAPYAQTSSIISIAQEGTQKKVVRGGTWFSFAAFYVRTSQRDSATPDTANSTIGFRCARDLD